MESDDQKAEILLTDIGRRPFEPFTLYLRVLENTGYEKVMGSPSNMYDMSRLSHGVKCAIQGCELFLALLSPDNFFDFIKLSFCSASVSAVLSKWIVHLVAERGGHECNPLCHPILAQ